MLEMAPTEADEFSEQARIKCSDRMFDSFEEIEDAFKGLGSSVPEQYMNKIKAMKQSLIETGANIGRMKSFYKSNISDMSESFVKKVSAGVTGYTLRKYQGEDARTINEMLHFIHANKLNNENFLESLPALERFKYGGDSFFEMNLLGRENEAARQIFDTLKDQETLGITDIVSLKDRIIMMVRDSGHALSIEMREDGETGEYSVDYYIPKICNAQKVNKLPGIRKVSEDSAATENTSGMFQSDKLNLASDIKSFIQQVPTDHDIIDRMADWDYSEWIRNNVTNK